MRNHHTLRVLLTLCFLSATILLTSCGGDDDTPATTTQGQNGSSGINGSANDNPDNQDPQNPLLGTWYYLSYTARYNDQTINASHMVGRSVTFYADGTYENSYGYPTFSYTYTYQEGLLQMTQEGQLQIRATVTQNEDGTITIQSIDNTEDALPEGYSVTFVYTRDKSVRNDQNAEVIGDWRIKLFTFNGSNQGNVGRLFTIRQDYTWSCDALGGSGTYEYAHGEMQLFTEGKLYAKLSVVVEENYLHITGFKALDATTQWKDFKKMDLNLVRNNANSQLWSDWLIDSFLYDGQYQTVADDEKAVKIREISDGTRFDSEYFGQATLTFVGEEMQVVQEGHTYARCHVIVTADTMTWTGKMAMPKENEKGNLYVLPEDQWVDFTLIFKRK